jgi:hypothetical protein
MEVYNMTMKVKGKDLFCHKEIDNYIAKFEDKIRESEIKITKLQEDITKIDAEIDVLMEKIIVKGNVFQKDLANAKARKQNLMTEFEEEKQMALKIRDIMAGGIEKLLLEASKQIDEDLRIFNDVVEKEIYRQLAEIRDKQEELLLLAEKAHRAVDVDIFQYNQICEAFGLGRYKRSVGFHNALFMPHRQFSEYSSALLNCSNLQSIESVLVRARADANAAHNSGKAEEDKEQLPPAKTMEDVDLDRFLKGIK